MYVVSTWLASPLRALMTPNQPRDTAADRWPLPRTTNQCRAVADGYSSCLPQLQVDFLDLPRSVTA